MHGFHSVHWVPVSERLFRGEKESIACLALLPDAEGEVLIQQLFGTYKKVSALRVWAERGGICLVTVLVGSSLVIAPIWIIRKLRGKLRNAGPLSVRVWPLIGSGALATFAILLVISFWGIITSTYIDDVKTGVPSLFTISLMLCSVVFPLAAIAGLYVAWRERSAPMKRGTYWHSVLVGLALIGTAIYFGYWGLIGLRLWA
jgi:hypothetical protein